ncbi:MAG TPA: hypothetical protein VMF14_00770 [Solirubrobacteraceae bacterium]|nr:hypothetical protein [Solirubrobacteraceae bacterium]
MTTKADFNAEDWSTVVDGPLYAGLRVIAADRGGTLRESLAMGRVYQDARAQHGSSELLDELVKSPPSIDAERLQQAGGDLSAVTTEHLRHAMSILESRATAEEADAYKTFVMRVAQAVAGAHKEGGFLGVGGKRVSDAENAALDEISHALGAPPAS